MTKKKAKKKKSNAGRPIKVTKEVVQKLEYAFSIGCSDQEACLYADIGMSTLYDYQNKNKEFSERKTILKRNPILKAKESVFKHIGKDPKFDLDLLKSTDEDYNPKKKVEVEDKREDKTFEEIRKLNKKFSKK